MSFDQYSDDELKEKVSLLKAEIERRERGEPPVAKNQINWEPLFKYVSTLVKDVSLKQDCFDAKDVKQHIFELVMEAIYGPGIWKWWNKNLHF